MLEDRRPRSKRLFRTLGVLLGAGFVGIGTIGFLVGFEGWLHALTQIVTGLVFLAYGVTGRDPYRERGRSLLRERDLP